MDPGALRGPPAPLAGDELEMVVLQRAARSPACSRPVRPQRLREILASRRSSEVLARLPRLGRNPADFDLELARYGAALRAEPDGSGYRAPCPTRFSSMRHELHGRG
jgi:hypothetical protein